MPKQHISECEQFLLYTKAEVDEGEEETRNKSNKMNTFFSTNPVIL